MFKVVRAILFTLTGFVLGVAAGAALVSLFSANTHDKSVEIAMTAAFVGGPAGAIVGLIAALAWKK